MVPVRRRAGARLAGPRVALVGEVRVAVDGVEATAAQLVADRGLAGGRDAFDEVVADAHQATVSGPG